MALTNLITNHGYSIFFIATIALVCSVFWWRNIIKKRKAELIKKNLELLQEISQENPLTY